MSEKKVTVRMPQSIYDRLKSIADASGWSFNEVAVQTIKSGMPPSVAKVPPSFHAELLALNKLDDQELWEVGRSHVADEDEASYEAEKAGLATLRRAYALALLKWRGHPVPDPSEFLL
ncbi:MAG: hypothetical protein L0332_10470 [Chloroflexi bacterium]|nr:hypothetical protein [Chloroflexota bacterium]MCI0576091.1 hypothetical protein [Chloroflexota bacterium]MCI0647879.1 hypothetical protein [Chloroflexota bacterium]MCI0727130.1 hypothetical protein [Chloroflexota bacterium]